jgi:hypothetical protein
MDPLPSRTPPRTPRTTIPAGLATSRGRHALIVSVLGIATVLLALRMIVFAAGLNATDERVRLVLLATEPVIRPFRWVVDATAARGTIEVASVAAGFLLLVAWSLVLARIDREPDRRTSDGRPERDRR